MSIVSIIYIPASQCQTPNKIQSVFKFFLILMHLSIVFISRASNMKHENEAILKNFTADLQPDWKKYI